jgi:uncharacterized membrane protein YagU involved in acid resistance
VQDVKPIIRGALAGFIGTALMTGAMFLVKKAEMAPGELAPKEVTENLEKKIGVYDRLPKPAFEVSWIMLHFGYGMASGAAYALAQEKTPDLNRPGLIGLLFGVLLWVIGYCGWLPVLGLYPSPTRLSKGKVGAELITTHLVYGTTTAVAHRVLSTRSA